jgi:hypothetical protein
MFAIFFRCAWRAFLKGYPYPSAGLSTPYNMEIKFHVDERWLCSSGSGWITIEEEKVGNVTWETGGPSKSYLHVQPARSYSVNCGWVGKISR